jgi:hypothetical protein
MFDVFSLYVVAELSVAPTNKNILFSLIVDFSRTARDTPNASWGSTPGVPPTCTWEIFIFILAAVAELRTALFEVQ